MPQRKFDGGDAACLLMAYYHLKPWELDDLDDAQRDLMLSRIGLLRYYHDLPYLQKTFGQLGDEEIDKIIAGTTDPKAAKRERAWDLWALARYGLLADAEAGAAVAPLTTISPEAAEGIVRWWESGDLMHLPDGPAIWAHSLNGLHKQLVARAAQYKDGLR